MALRFPTNCNTPEKRTGYCYRAQELLRLIHNAMGKWHREGLTENQWNEFPQRIKNRYPYASVLTDEQWDDFTNLFDRFEDKVIQPLLSNRQLLKNSMDWTVDVDNALEE